jgi:hypothetical protein
MARSLKAAVAAAKAAKDSWFRAFKDEFGLSLENDGEVLALITLRRLLHGTQLLDLPRNVKMGHRANKPPRWSQTPPPWLRFPPFPPICRR